MVQSVRAAQGHTWLPNKGRLGLLDTFPLNTLDRVNIVENEKTKTPGIHLRSVLSNTPHYSSFFQESSLIRCDTSFRMILARDFSSKLSPDAVLVNISLDWNAITHFFVSWRRLRKKDVSQKFRHRPPRRKLLWLRSKSGKGLG